MISMIYFPMGNFVNLVHDIVDRSSCLSTVNRDRGDLLTCRLPGAGASRQSP
jgi:hypothetical protein